ALPRPGQARRNVRDPGVAVVLLQEPNARPRPLSGARPLHPADEVEEHAAIHDRRGADHAPWARILRLGWWVRPVRRFVGFVRFVGSQVAKSLPRRTGLWRTAKAGRCK